MIVGKFTFIVPPLMGHVNPTLSLGAELMRRGHAVSWISPDESLGAHLPGGGELLVCHDGGNLEQLDMIRKKDVYGAESIKFLYDEVLIPLNRYMFRGIVRHLDRFAPDVVINDHQMFAGAIAACKKGIPYATSITAPAAIAAMDDLPGVHEWETKRIVGLQRELGMEGDKPVACSETTALLFTSQEFFGEKQLP